MAADKMKKIADGKKNSKATATIATVEPIVESSPTRVSRRTASPAKSSQRTASSPSPAAKKVLKKKRKSTSFLFG